jgi:hypothetical protein
VALLLPRASNQGVLLQPRLHASTQVVLLLLHASIPAVLLQLRVSSQEDLLRPQLHASSQALLVSTQGGLPLPRASTQGVLLQLPASILVARLLLRASTQADLPRPHVSIQEGLLLSSNQGQTSGEGDDRSVKWSE